MNQITALPGIVDALGERSVMTLAELQTQLDEGNATLWQGYASAIFMRRVEYANGEVILEVGPAGGNMQEILEVTPSLEDWARSIGCTQVMVLAGRGGWAPMLKPQGYEVHQTILRKVL